MVHSFLKKFLTWFTAFFACPPIFFHPPLMNLLILALPLLNAPLRHFENLFLMFVKPFLINFLAMGIPFFLAQFAALLMPWLAISSKGPRCFVKLFAMFSALLTPA